MFNSVTWLGKAVFTDEDRQSLKAIALELKELRKLVMELAEKMVNASDNALSSKNESTICGNFFTHRFCIRAESFQLQIPRRKNSV